MLARSEIDDIAENIISDYNPNLLFNGQCINIEDLIERYYLLNLDYQYLSNDGRFLGATIFNDTKTAIIYNPAKNEAEYLSVPAGTLMIDSGLLNDSSEGRYRFTLAHELGHWILHQKFFKCYFVKNSTRTGCDELIQCRKRPAHFDRYRTEYWSEIDWVEWQANAFAASLLMPKTSITHFFEHKKWYMREEAIYSVADNYRTSLTATEFRLRDLRIIID